MVVLIHLKSSLASGRLAKNATLTGDILINGRRKTLTYGSAVCLVTSPEYVASSMRVSVSPHVTVGTLSRTSMEHVGDESKNEAAELSCQFQSIVFLCEEGLPHSMPSMCLSVWCSGRPT